jgi:hypothetical protein
MIKIECSGIHRSLGTHISKVRSLTLDSSSSFTPDIVQLLLSIGNANSNAVWEEACNNKPIPTDSRDIKLKYIQSKYVDKQFVSSKQSRDPMEILYKAIEQDDIPQALYAIALGANINQPFSLEIIGDNVIPLLSNKTRNRNSVLKLPILDVAGNEYLDKRTLEVTDPSLNYYSVRYALHFALLSRHAVENEDLEEEEDMEDPPPKPDGPVNLMCDETEEEEEDSEATSLSEQEDCDSEEEQEYTRRMFPMAEFLFQNGADVFIIDIDTGRLLADLVGLGDLVDDEAVGYLNMKNSLRGQSAIIRSHIMPPPSNPSS